MAGAAVVVGALVLSACAAAADSTGGGPGGKISIMANSGEILPEQIEAFTKETGIEVTFSEFDQTKLNAMIAAGKAPDIIRGSGAAETPYLGTRGLALPLDDYIADSDVIDEDDLNVLGDVWKWDGATQGEGPRYGLMKDYSQDTTIWYNKKAFEAAGLEVPSDDTPLTYDEILELGRKLTIPGGDGTVTQYGTWTQLPGIEILSSMVATADGQIFADDLRSVDFTSPEALKALQWYVDAGQARIGYSLVDVNPDGWDGPPFASEKIAMTQNGYWFSGIVGGSETAPEWGRLAPAPVLGSTRFSPTTGATGHYISAFSKNPDAAWAFLEYYTAGQPGIDRAKAGWGLPALNSLREYLPQELEYQKLALATQEKEEAYAGVLQFSPFVQTSAANAVIQEIVPKAINGDITVREAAEEITERTNELIDQGIELTEG
ncbi:ABC transporter substrate-binding protein [Agromyces albus]|nr:sugar ABC transporter substrate-binding protein [Agromyces albus]